MAIPSKGRYFKKAGARVYRRVVFERISANATATLPKYGSVRRVQIINHTANAVTGGINIGITDGGTGVLNAQAVAANALLDVAAAGNVLSASADQTLYVNAGSSWNSAVISVVVEYAEIDPTL